jgi:hypothetical protein
MKDSRVAWRGNLAFLLSFMILEPAALVKDEWMIKANGILGE